MKIAVVAYDTALPGEKGLGRMYYLAGLFRRYGYEAELITGSFQHWEKRFRTAAEMDAARAQCDVAFMEQTAYRKNIDLRRVRSLRRMARSVWRHLNQNDYDLVYCLIPDNHIAAVAARYARQRGVPFIIDVEDLWPEAMRMVFDVPVLSDVLFSYFTINARRAYRLADGVIGSGTSRSNTASPSHAVRRSTSETTSPPSTPASGSTPARCERPPGSGGSPTPGRSARATISRRSSGRRTSSDGAARRTSASCCSATGRCGGISRRWRRRWGRT